MPCAVPPQDEWAKVSTTSALMGNFQMSSEKARKCIMLVLEPRW